MPRPSRQGVGLWKVFGLAALVAGTSWVVADLASAWLVPPYLVVMALILLPSNDATRRRNEASRVNRPPRGVDLPSNSRVRSAGDGLADPLDSSEPSSTPNDGTTDGGATASKVEQEGGSASATASKSKRGRSRPRKPSKPADPAELAPANWVEVGPGKFVRVEAATTPEPVAGPHLPVGSAPVLPLFDDDSMASEPGALETPEEPTGSWVGFEPGSSPAIDVNVSLRFESRTLTSVPVANPVDGIIEDTGAAEPIEANGPVALESPVLSDFAAPEAGFAPSLDFNAPTIDGNTLQVERADLLVLESDLDSGATEPEMEPGSHEGRFGPAPVALADAAESPRHLDDEVEVGTDLGATDDLEPMFDRRKQGFPKVDPEGLDQGEVLSRFEEASRSDLDANSPILEVSSDEYSFFRSVPPSQAVCRGRVGLGRRSGRKVPPGHFGRTPRSTRRPVDPRRPSGRKVGRPRQIIRASPPRSPPSSRSGRL